MRSEAGNAEGGADRRADRARCRTGGRARRALAVRRRGGAAGDHDDHDDHAHRPLGAAADDRPAVVPAPPRRRSPSRLPRRAPRPTRKPPRTRRSWRLVPAGSCVRIVDGDTVVAESGAGDVGDPCQQREAVRRRRRARRARARLPIPHRVQSPPPLAGGVLRRRRVPGRRWRPGAAHRGRRPIPCAIRRSTRPRSNRSPTRSSHSASPRSTATSSATAAATTTSSESRRGATTSTEPEAGPYDALLVNDGLISPGNYGLDPSRSAARDLLRPAASRAASRSPAPPPTQHGRPTQASPRWRSIESRPLTDVLVEMLHTSDNNTAEMMLKEIGYTATRAGHTAGRARHGRGRRSNGGACRWTGVDLRDGSGLDRANRATCEALTAVVGSTAGRRRTASVCCLSPGATAR